MKRRFTPARGFTMLEMMIVLTIVAILAAIALPMYQDAVTRGKLIDATVRLGDYRSQMEKWFLDNRDYRDAGGACGIPAPAPGAHDPFALSCTAPTATTYEVKAKGRAAGGMSTNFEFTVNQTNARASTGDGANWAGNANCWAVRKDGTCQ